MSAHVTDRLSAYLDRELSVVDADAVHEHLAGCEACAKRLAHLAAVDGSLRDLPAEAPAGYFDSFASRVRGRIETAGRPQSRFRLPVWSWAVAAALLVAVVLPRMLWDRAASRSPVPADRPLPVQAPAAPGALPLPAKGGEQPRPDASMPVDGAEADRLAALGYARPASADDKARAKAPAARALDVRGPQKLEASAERRYARATPEAPLRLSRAPSAPAESGKADALTGEKATSDRAASLAAEETALRDEAEAKVAGSSSLEKDQRQEDSAAARPQPAVAAPGRVEGQKRSRLGAAGTMAPAPLSSVDAEYRVLDSLAARASLSEQRDAWRAFVARHPADARADEARVRVIALGVEIARQTGAGGDLAQARKDAEDYLARQDAGQKERVRALVDGLSR